MNVGDTFTLDEDFEEKKYTFTVTGIYDYMGSISMFLNQKNMNQKFELGDGYFSGYFSNEPITDIDEKYIGTVIDKEEMTKVSRQLLISMGSLMYLVDVLSIIIFMAMVYLLSKMIIEKNMVSISMAKILGYKNMEITRLYVMATSLVVILSLLLLLPLEANGLVAVFKMAIRMEMHGWFNIAVPSKIMCWMFLIGGATYGVVMVFELLKIRRIPMDEALKMDE